MGESIRSLTVKLGYDVDTTGADVFKSRFKSLRDFLRKGTSGLKTKISLRDLFGKPNFKKFENDFNSKFKKSTGRIASATKKAMLVVAAAIAVGVAAATKVFKGFAEIAQARISLKFLAGDDFDRLTEKLNKIRGKEGIKGLVSELESLNALKLGGEIIGDLDFLVDNFETVVKLAKITGRDVLEVQQAFANFVATGSNLEELKKFKFFTAEELDALKKASTDFSQQGLETRKTLIGGKIQEVTPEIDKAFKDFTKSGQANIDRLGVSAERATIALGENFAPGINNILKGLTDSANRFGDALKGDAGFLKAFLDSFQSDTARSVIRFFGGDIKESEEEKKEREKEEKRKKETNIETQKNLDKLGAGSGLLGFGLALGRPSNVTPNAITEKQTAQQLQTTNNQDTVTNTTTININGDNKDPQAIAREVESSMAKRIINSSARREVPQALNTTIQPTVSQ